MGIIARVASWLWRRWGDWQSVTALLDLFDLKTFVVGVIAFFFTFVYAAYDNWGSAAVWLAALIAGACVSVIYVGWRFSRLSDPKAKVSASTNVASGFEYDVPDIRVADDIRARELLVGPECDKLFPLLEAGKISAWGRPMGPGQPPLTSIDRDFWKTHYVDYHPAQPGQFISQTFLKTKTRHETRYYDLYFNRGQLNRVWPQFSERDIKVIS